MKVRLAFSVAAHLEPEILIVDEVLSVGDADFQKKSLSKMENIGQEGRTVLFVSHSMSAISRLCERAILLERGKVIADGPAHQVVSSYLNSSSGTSAERVWSDPGQGPGRSSCSSSGGAGAGLKMARFQSHLTFVIRSDLKWNMT